MSVKHIADRIDGFVNKDPDRVIDMWSKNKNWLIHQKVIERLMLNGFSPSSPASLLDAGCGTGDFVNSLIRLGFNQVQVTGFDCSPAAIQAAKDRWLGGTWFVAESPFPELEGCEKFDFGVCLGPFCYTQGTNKWDCFRMLPDLMKVCSHGVGYFMYTDVRNSKPGKWFTRFYPEEVKERFPECRIVTDPTLISEFGSNYEDLDKVLIIW